MTVRHHIAAPDLHEWRDLELRGREEEVRSLRQQIDELELRLLRATMRLQQYRQRARKVAQDGSNEDHLGRGR